jgi:antirestriction protein ArdC
MKTTDIKAAFATIQASLFSALETADKWECPWLKLLFSFHNPLSNAGKGHTFTGFVNCAILAMVCAMRGWTDPRFVTYSQVKAGKGKDWWLDGGELSKSITLFFPRIREDKQTDGTIKRVFIGWGTYGVYSAHQCSKSPALPTLDAGAFQPIEACESTLAAMRGMPAIQHGGADACYIPCIDALRMPPRESFRSSEEYYSTLFHELAHATGHKSRLNREDNSNRDQYAREELVAETCAAILCAYHGIHGRTIENSRAYVAGWKSRCAEDDQLFSRSMREGLAAAEWILGKRGGHAPASETLD